MKDFFFMIRDVKQLLPVFLFFLLALFVACLPASQGKSRGYGNQATLDAQGQSDGGVEGTSEVLAVTSKEPPPEIQTNDQGEIYRTSYRARKVSSLDLEESNFAIDYLTPSLQEYLQSETVILAFERPMDSDYVEILRCNSDVVVDTGIVLVDFKDWALNGMTEEEKLSLYSAGDVFTMALQQQGCVYLNQGSVEEDIPDSWAPSGSYRYLAVSCVAPNRLVDTDLVSKRNCSKRFAISPLVHYTNQRKEAEKEAIRDLETVRSALDILASTIGEQAFSLVEAMDECEQREYQRGVDTATKNAVLQVVGAAMELTIEILDFCQSRGLLKKAAKNIAKNGAKGAMEGAADAVADNAAKAAKKADIATPNVGRKATSQVEVDPSDKAGGFQTTVDMMQMGQAMEGMTFTMILTNLFADASDTPRSCETALSLNEKLETTMEQVFVLAQQHVYFEKVLEQVRKGLSDQAGLESEDVDIETLNPGAGGEGGAPESSGGGLYDD